MKFYQDGQLIFDITDPDLKTGKFGLYCWGNEGSEFKNISANPIQERHAAEQGHPVETEQIQREMNLKKCLQN